ncbi:MAG: hypothetical protein GY711_04605 [bacterium]|nr:hypothetical protein [bacterium]
MQLSLPQTPTPTGVAPVLAGETRFFPAWFRDNNPTSTSNFSSGVSVSFQ